MKKQSLYFAILLSLGVSSIKAQDCTGVTQWSASTTYSNANMKVVQLGVLYHSNFWTNNQLPATNNGGVGSGQPWASEGTCLAGTDEGNTSTNSNTNWILTGNVLTDGNFLGSTNNKALLLKANNFEGLFVNPEKGSVSIGKALYPSYYKFEVNEGLTAFTGPNQVNQNNLMVLYSGNKSTARYGQGYRHYTGFSHALYPSGEEYGIINTFEYNSATGSGIGKHLLIQNTNEGNLGVGIFNNAPPAKLSVNGNTYLTGGLSLGTTDFSHFTNYKLVVNGKILAKGLKVQTSGWADFVFDEDYKLMSLQQVEEYIKEHKHLPSVPSATEVLSEGIDVAEMNKILLQKIEELTLNTIELSKKVNVLEQELNKMKDQ